MLKSSIAILFLSVSLIAQSNDKLTDLEQTRLTNVYLTNELKLAYTKLEACTTDLGNKKSTDWDKATQDQLKKLKEDIEKNHKGYMWTPENGLVLKSKEDKEKK